MDRHDIFGLIDDERDRQEDHVRAGRFKATCASDELTLTDKAAVLTEECGEVSGAALQLSQLTSDRADRSELRKELIHVAAVAVAWLESLDVEVEQVKRPPIMAYSATGRGPDGAVLWHQAAREIDAPPQLETWAVANAEQLARYINAERGTPLPIVEYVFECVHPVVGMRIVSVTADRIQVSKGEA